MDISPTVAHKLSDKISTEGIVETRKSEIPPSTTTEGFVWKFGYGSNMSVTYLKNKKQIPVLEYYPAVLRGWALCFNFGISRWYEPGFANIIESSEDEVHGLLVKITKEAGILLDKQEFSYEIKEFEVEIYNSRQKILAQVFVGKKTTANAFHVYPSKRYMNLLINGAKETGLDPNYIELLEKQPFYTPTRQILEKRKNVPHPSLLPKMSIEELKKFCGEPEGIPCYTSVCGYIFEFKTFMKFQRGRDTTLISSPL